MRVAGTDDVRGLGIGIGLVGIGMSRMPSRQLVPLCLVYRVRSRRSLSRAVSILLAGRVLWLLSMGSRVILAEMMDSVGILWIGLGVGREGMSTIPVNAVCLRLLGC
jgi:hypothetical protein